MKATKNKHMDLNVRIEIQQCLDKGMTFKAIGQWVGKDQTTISKEVKKHMTIKEPPVHNFLMQPCKKLMKSPFVCNPCERRNKACRHQKQFYYAKKAQNEYEFELSDSRMGIPLNKEEFYEIDRIIHEKVRQGQRLYHILETNDLGVSKSSVYRHLHRGYLSISKLDLPRVVKFKARKKPYMPSIPKKAKIGRLYEDFQTFIAENDINSWVEMDTLIGKVGGKTIVTFDFTFCNFMFGLLLEDKTSFEVSRKIADLKRKFGEAGLKFGDIFPIILTDNGGEFADIWTIENNLENEKECNLFFCDPMQSCQKPHVEKNHTLFRDIVPKGSSFDDFTQDTVDLIFSHVNAVKRKILNGKSPYDLFAFTFGENIARILGVSNISPQDVIQSPKLLKM